VGLLVDLKGLSPAQKLAGQSAAALLAYHAGIRMASIGDLPLDPMWSLPLTVLWLVGCANAFNLIDGMDGLAAGLGLCASVTMVLAALLQGNAALAVATVPLAGALLGFLRYNFNPASIFLGDCGSLLTGFFLGCFSITWSQKSTSLLAMMAPLVTLAIPLVDTALAIFRRFVKGKPAFAGDRRHIHHRLLDRGLTTRQSLMILYGTAVLAALVSLLLGFVHSNWTGLAVAGFGIAAWMGLQRLDYGELEAVRRIVRSSGIQRRLNREASLDQLERALNGATTPSECWEVVKDCALEAGFVAVHLTFADTRFQHGKPSSPDLWAVQVPVGGSGQLQLFRDPESSADTTLIGPFAEVASRLLGGKTFPLETRSTEPTSIAALSDALNSGVTAMPMDISR